MRVAFHLSDLFIGPSSTTQSLDTKTALAGTTTSSIITSLSDASDDSNSRALSTGAWIGIGLAIGGRTLILLATIF